MHICLKDEACLVPRTASAAAIKPQMLHLHYKDGMNMIPIATSISSRLQLHLSPVHTLMTWLLCSIMGAFFTTLSSYIFPTIIYMVAYRRVSTCILCKHAHVLPEKLGIICKHDPFDCSPYMDASACHGVTLSGCCCCCCCCCCC